MEGATITMDMPGGTVTMYTETGFFLGLRLHNLIVLGLIMEDRPTLRRRGDCRVFDFKAYRERRKA